MVTCSWPIYYYDIPSRFSNNSEASASELPENLGRNVSSVLHGQWCLLAGSNLHPHTNVLPVAKNLRPILIWRPWYIYRVEFEPKSPSAIPTKGPNSKRAKTSYIYVIWCLALADGPNIVLTYSSV